MNRKVNHSGNGVVNVLGPGERQQLRQHLSSVAVMAVSLATTDVSEFILINIGILTCIAGVRN